MGEVNHPLANFISAIELLMRHGVDFIVVGGVAACLQGVDYTTKDLDIVFDRSPVNRARLLAALQDLGAHYKDPAGRYIVPDDYKLDNMRMHLLRTRLGDLDVLSKVGGDLAYSDLIGETIKRELSGLQVPLLRLEAIIRTKEFANGVEHTETR